MPQPEAVIRATHHAAEQFTWSWVTILMCALGLALHLLLVWAEDRKNDKLAPGWPNVPSRRLTTWFMDDPVPPIIAFASAAALYVGLPELSQFAWIKATIGADLGFSPLGAFGVGLLGSYIGKKLFTLFSK